jgi:hypothetical protein
MERVAADQRPQPSPLSGRRAVPTSGHLALFDRAVAVFGFKRVEAAIACAYIGKSTSKNQRRWRLRVISIHRVGAC